MGAASSTSASPRAVGGSSHAARIPEARTGRLPLIVAGGIPLMVAALWPLRMTELGSSAAFLPAFLSAVLVLEGVTVIVLLTQYAATGNPRLWALSWAYTWSVVTVVPHALVFPGVVTETGMLAAAPSSAPWLWTAWHVGFVLLLGAALMPWPARWARTHARGVRARWALLGVVGLAGASALFTAWVTVWSAYAPVIIADGDYTRLTELLGVPVLVLCGAALAVSWWGVLLRRSRSGLEAWALIALTAGVSDTAITLLARERLTVGWYGARVLALAAAAVVLGALLAEVTVLHRRMRAYADTVADQNDELQRAAELRDRVIGVVSHELGTPLTGLIGYLELLLDDVTYVEEVDEHTVKMLERCSSLARRSEIIAEDLLTVAAVSNGQTLVCRLETVDVAAALEEVTLIFHGLDVRTACPDGLTVIADPTRLGQLLTNLVRNAQKYGAEPVTVRAEAGDGTVRITVTDAGDGVPAEFVPHLFEEYSRADGHTGVKGAGLGMWISQELVRGQGGTLAYVPETHLFVITLPAPLAGSEGPSATSLRPRWDDDARPIASPRSGDRDLDSPAMPL